MPIPIAAMALLGGALGGTAPWILSKIFDSDSGSSSSSNKPSLSQADEWRKTERSGYKSAPTYSEPIFSTAARHAAELYHGGVGGNVYPYERVAPLGQQTLTAINTLGDVSQNLQNPYLRGLMSSPLPIVSNLQGLASGAQIGQNPQFDAALQNALRNVATNINEVVSGAGRYGSGAHTGVLANRLGQISTQATADQYNRDIANMMAANQLISQSQLGQMSAAGQLAGAQSNAAMAALRGSSIADMHRQRQYDAARQMWHEYDEAPWQRLNRYVQLGRNISGDYNVTGDDLLTYAYKKPDIMGNIGKIADIGLKAAQIYYGGGAGAGAGAGIR